MRGMVAVLAVLLLAACGNGGGNAPAPAVNKVEAARPDRSMPQSALKEWQAAWAAGDGSRLLACYAEARHERWKRKIREQYEPAIAAGGSFKLEYTEAEIAVEGDKFTVPIVIHKRETADAELQQDRGKSEWARVNGEWKCVD